MAYDVTTVDGLSWLNLPRSDYARLLSQTLKRETATLDIWLTHIESGLTCTVFPSGLLRLSSPDWPRHRYEWGPVALSEAVTAWDLLGQGKQDALMLMPWERCEIP
jgi:hypothetical protein